MIFSLEALQARKGDSLILHYGDPSSPNFIVIDGGPDGVYASSLRPRLAQLHRKWKNEDDDKLHLEMVMISHIDDDHINGILDWMMEIERDRAVSCNIATLWYNSFDAVLQNAAQVLTPTARSLSSENAGA